MGEKKTGTCECCGFEEIPLTEYKHGSSLPNCDAPYWLCMVCATSMAGQYNDYLCNDATRGELASLMAWMTNHILSEMRKLLNERSEDD